MEVVTPAGDDRDGNIMEGLRAKARGWLIVAELSAVLALVLLPGSSFSAVMPMVEREWGISHSQSGLVMAAYQAWYILSVLVLLPLTDRVDARFVVTASAGVSAGASILFGLLARGPFAATALRAVAGAGLGGVYMPGLRLVSEQYRSSARGRAVGVYVAAFVLGNGLSFGATGSLAAVMNWRAAYLVVSAVSTLAVGLAMLVPRGRRPEGATGAKGRRAVSGWLGLGVDWPTMLVIIAYSAHMWEMYGLRSWMAPYVNSVLVAKGQSGATAASRAALLTSASVFLGAAATGAAGWVSDRCGRTATASVIMIASAAATLAFGWLAAAPAGALLGVGLLSSLTVNADSPIFSAGVTEMVDSSTLGRAMAVQTFLGYAAATASPALFGWILDAADGRVGWGVAFSSMGVVALAGPVALWRLRRMPASRRMCQGRR